MSLVVVDPDGEASNLCRQLDQLGFEPVSAADLKLAQSMCDHSAPDMLVCSEMDWAKQLAQQHRRIPVVLALQDAPDAETLTHALRLGLADVWTLPMADTLLQARVDDILARSKAAASQAERRLSQYVADLQRDQRAGRYIQMGMLPPNPMAIDRYRIQHRIVPSLILSGDFVDYFRITDRYFALYVADVSGHGASSAFVTVLLKNFSRRLRREYRPSMLSNPGEILEWINRELLEQKIDKHVAMILAVVDLQNDTASLANAGHFPPALLVRGESALAPAHGEPRAQFVEQKGKPLGLFESVSYESVSLDLEAGDGLVVFSDGVLEAFDGMDLARKEARLAQAAGGSWAMDGIWNALGLDAASEVPDDMTCLILRRES
jgi:serine phosphatase RsbU (regulator of sigma subunit)